MISAPMPATAMSSRKMPVTTMPDTTKPLGSRDAGWTPRDVAAVGAPARGTRHPRFKPGQGQ